MAKDPNRYRASGKQQAIDIAIFAGLALIAIIVGPRLANRTIGAKGNQPPAGV